ncbi:MAG: hypothetical protein VX642_04515 [Bdellovibrionota bacterium]|nr:hypothetical protein [Bdellovibrionota bacterium]
MKNWLNLTSILLIFFSTALNAQTSSCGQSARLSYEELNRFSVKLNSAIEAEAIDANRMRFEFATKLSPLINQLIKKSFSYRLENEIKEDIQSDLLLYISEHFQVFYKNGKFSIYHLTKEL